MRQPTPTVSLQRSGSHTSNHGRIGKVAIHKRAPTAKSSWKESSDVVRRLSAAGFSQSAIALATTQCSPVLKSSKEVVVIENTTRAPAPTSPPVAISPVEESQASWYLGGDHGLLLLTSVDGDLDSQVLERIEPVAFEVADVALSVESLVTDDDVAIGDFDVGLLDRITSNIASGQQIMEACQAQHRVAPPPLVAPMPLPPTAAPMPQPLPCPQTLPMNPLPPNPLASRVTPPGSPLQPMGVNMPIPNAPSCSSLVSQGECLEDIKSYRDDSWSSSAVSNQAPSEFRPIAPLHVAQ